MIYAIHLRKENTFYNNKWKPFYAEAKTINSTNSPLLDREATWAWSGTALFVFFIVSLVLKVKSCPPSFHLKGEFTFNLLNGTPGPDQGPPFRGNSPFVVDTQTTQTHTHRGKGRGSGGSQRINVCVGVCRRSPWASVHTCWRSCRAGSCSQAWGPPVWGCSLCWAACTCKHHQRRT